MTGFEMQELEQRTMEWFEMRAGKPTASRFSDIMAVSKRDGKPLKARTTYAYQLVAERIAGPMPSPSTAAMRRGTEQEPFVRRLYAARTGFDVQETGFVLSACGRYGASPDGLVGEDGLVEIKTREPHLFVTDLLNGPTTVPEDYRWQMIGQCLVTGRPWCDLAQYSAPVRGFRIVRYEPTQKELDQLAAQLEAFCEEVDGFHVLARELLAEVCVPIEALPWEEGGA